MPKKEGRNRPIELTLALTGRDQDETAPKLALHAVMRDGEILESIEVGDGDAVKFSDKAMSAEAIVVLSAETKPDAQALKDGYRLSPAQLARAAEVSGTLTLSPSRWRPLLPFGLCVDGSVRKCWWWPVYVKAATAQLATTRSLSINTGFATTAKLGPSAAIADRILQNLQLRRCRPVCEGIVEVYERTCCCWPIIIPPVIYDIRDRLRRLLERLPDIRIPPRPQPDPIPFRKAGMFISGTLDETALNAAADLAYLESAPFEEARAYIEARPYLVRMICSCGPTKYRGAALIGPDGQFSLCYPGNPFLPVNCHREYAFRVRQVIDGVDTVIYDGVAAGIWFDADEDITLTTYHPDAIECPGIDLPIPTDTPYAMLERIGGTEAWNLKTPEPTGWDRAAVTSYNDGLAFPAASVAAARGTYLDRNWGGVLGLRYLFTPSLKAQGAKYYRVRVAKADINGNPIGTPKYMDDPIAWKYWENLGGYPPQIKIRVQSLNLSSDPSYYEIPYTQDHNWLSNYNHAHVDTRKFDDGRHLVTLELYDSALKRLAPNNALDAAGSDTKKPFAYEWWHDPLDATDPENTTNVPYAGLTHMFWWDNRDCVADITKLINTGIASNAQCQFMSGTGSSTFGAEFRAYHPYNQGDASKVSFMHSWRLRYWKGLGGTEQSLDTGTEPQDPGLSATETFATMLGGDTKCTFSLQLYVETKTFDGSGTLDALDEADIASFALDMTP